MNRVKISGLYLKYKYIFTKEEFYKIAHEILRSIKDDNISENIKEIFIERLNNYISDYLKICLKDTNKLLNIIFNFINENIEDKDNYNASLKELQKLTVFLAKLDIKPDYYFFIELIENSEILKNLLSTIVDNNMNLIKTNSLDKLFSDNILLSLIEAYCLLYNIYKDDDFIVFGNKIVCSSLDLYEKDIKMLAVSDYRDDELLKLVKAGDSSAKDTLVQKNLGLVLLIAVRYLNRGLELDDLIQEGNIGLIKAVDKYDNTRGTKFSTCAKWWISNEILSAIDDKSRDFRITETAKNSYYKFKKEYKSLKEMLKREPTYEEIAKKMHMSLFQIWQLCNIYQGIINLDDINDSDEDNLSFNGDIAFNMDEYIDYQALRNEILYLLKNCGLSDKEIIIILLRYGFYNDKQMSFIEISKIVGVSRERARQLEATALKRITNSFLTRSLASYTGNPQKALLELQNLRNFYNEQGYDCYRKRFIDKK